MFNFDFTISLGNLLTIISMFTITAVFWLLWRGNVDVTLAELRNDLNHFAALLKEVRSDVKELLGIKRITRTK